MKKFLLDTTIGAMIPLEKGVPFRSVPFRSVPFRKNLFWQLTLLFFTLFFCNTITFITCNYIGSKSESNHRVVERQCIVETQCIMETQCIAFPRYGDYQTINFILKGIPSGSDPSGSEPFISVTSPITKIIHSEERFVVVVKNIFKKIIIGVVI